MRPIPPRASRRSWAGWGSSERSTGNEREEPMKDDKMFQERRARINELRAKNERMSCRERAHDGRQAQGARPGPDRQLDGPGDPEEDDGVLRLRQLRGAPRFPGGRLPQQLRAELRGPVLQEAPRRHGRGPLGGQAQDRHLRQGHGPPGHLHRGGRVPPGKDEDPGGNRKVRPLGQRRLVGLFQGQGRLQRLSSRSTASSTWATAWTARPSSSP